MTRIASLLAALAATGLGSAAPSLAAETPMKGPDILSALKGGRVEGDSWSQTFANGGATDYTANGSPSAGHWDVRGDQYCSQWPPSESWACYDMTFDPATGRISFIAADGSRSPGRLVRKGE